MDFECLMYYLDETGKQGPNSFTSMGIAGGGSSDAGSGNQHLNATGNTSSANAASNNNNNNNNSSASTTGSNVSDGGGGGGGGSNGSSIPNLAGPPPSISQPQQLPPTTNGISEGIDPQTGFPIKKRRIKNVGPPVRPQCSECGKDFSNQSALSKHKLTHSDERKFVCNICSKAFKRQDHLNGHMLTHRDKKPFECDVEGCEKTYCDARSLRRHKENHHAANVAGVLQGGSVNQAQIDQVFGNPILRRTITHHPDSQNLLHQLLTQQLKESSSESTHIFNQLTPSLSNSNNHLSNNNLVNNGNILNNNNTINLNNNNGSNGWASVEQVNKWLESQLNQVECTVCQKRFKNLQALNGHMRSHGGYMRPQQVITTANNLTQNGNHHHHQNNNNNNSFNITPICSTPVQQQQQQQQPPSIKKKDHIEFPLSLNVNNVNNNVDNVNNNSNNNNSEVLIEVSIHKPKMLSKHNASDLNPTTVHNNVSVNTCNISSTPSANNQNNDISNGKSNKESKDDDDCTLDLTINLKPVGTISPPVSRFSAYSTTCSSSSSNYAIPTTHQETTSRLVSHPDDTDMPNSKQPQQQQPTPLNSGQSSSSIIQQSPSNGPTTIAPNPTNNHQIIPSKIIQLTQESSSLVDTTHSGDTHGSYSDSNQELNQLLSGGKEDDTMKESSSDDHFDANWYQSVAALKEQLHSLPQFRMPAAVPFNNSHDSMRNNRSHLHLPGEKSRRHSDSTAEMVFSSSSGSHYENKIRSWNESTSNHVTNTTVNGDDSSIAANSTTNHHDCSLPTSSTANFTNANTSAYNANTFDLLKRRHQRATSDPGNGEMDDQEGSVQTTTQSNQLTNNNNSPPNNNLLTISVNKIYSHSPHHHYTYNSNNNNNNHQIHSHSVPTTPTNLNPLLSPAVTHQISNHANHFNQSLPCTPTQTNSFSFSPHQVQQYHQQQASLPATPTDNQMQFNFPAQQSSVNYSSPSYNVSNANPSSVPAFDYPPSEPPTTPTTPSIGSTRQQAQPGLEPIYEEMNYSTNEESNVNEHDVNFVNFEVESLIEQISTNHEQEHHRQNHHHHHSQEQQLQQQKQKNTQNSTSYTQQQQVSSHLDTIHSSQQHQSNDHSDQLVTIVINKSQTFFPNDDLEAQSLDGPSVNYNLINHHHNQRTHHLNQQPPLPQQQQQQQQLTHQHHHHPHQDHQKVKHQQQQQNHHHHLSQHLQNHHPHIAHHHSHALLQQQQQHLQQPHLHHQQNHHHHQQQQQLTTNHFDRHHHQQQQLQHHHQHHQADHSQQHHSIPSITITNSSSTTTTTPGEASAHRNRSGKGLNDQREESEPFVGTHYVQSNLFKEEREEKEICSDSITSNIVNSINSSTATSTTTPTIGSTSVFSSSSVTSPNKVDENELMESNSCSLVTSTSSNNNNQSNCSNDKNNNNPSINISQTHSNTPSLACGSESPTPRSTLRSSSSNLVINLSPEESKDIDEDEDDEDDEDDDDADSNNNGKDEQIGISYDEDDDDEDEEDEDDDVFINPAVLSPVTSPKSNQNQLTITNNLKDNNYNIKSINTTNTTNNESCNNNNLTTITSTSATSSTSSSHTSVITNKSSVIKVTPVNERSSSNKRPKHKPEPLYIPPHVNAFGQYASRLRSPRLWDPTGLHSLPPHDVNKSSPPPYTPPPMLSPLRKGSGLYWAIINNGNVTPKSANLGTFIHARKSLSSTTACESSVINLQSSESSANIASTTSTTSITSPSKPSTATITTTTPHNHNIIINNNSCNNNNASSTPTINSTATTIIHHHHHNISKEILCSKSSELIISSTPTTAYEPDTPYDLDLVPSESDIQPHVNIGPQYQASIPAYIGDKIDVTKRYRRERAGLVWNPIVLDKLNQPEDLDYYLELACSSCVPGAGRNIEFALHLLYMCNGDLEEAIGKLLNTEPIKLRPDHPLIDYQYPESDVWSQEEINLYYQALIKFDKDFHTIAQKVKTKTVKECIQFYYLWKKICPEEYKRLRIVRRRKEQEGLFYSNPVVTKEEETEDNDVDNKSAAEGDAGDDDALSIDSPMNASPSSVSSTATTGATVGGGGSGGSSGSKDKSGHFPCRVCGKVFSKVKSRSAHMKVHGAGAASNPAYSASAK